METRQVKEALRAMPIKTERRDVAGIARPLHLGWLRPVHCKSVSAQEVRAVFCSADFQAGRRWHRAGPFNSLGSCGALEKWRCHKGRVDGLPWLLGRLVRETVYKIAVGKGEANLKEQVCPSFRPADLLLFDHPPCNEIVDTRFGRSGGDPLPFAISCALAGDRTSVLLDVGAQVQQPVSQLEDAVFSFASCQKRRTRLLGRI